MRPRLLLIDDEEDLLDVCRLGLEPEGFTVETVAHAEEGPLLATVRQFQPTLILLDLVMPSASGEEVARWLRAEPYAKDIPILVMSALSGGDATARHMRAQGFLKKPFTVDALLGAVNKLIEGGGEPIPAP